MKKKFWEEFYTLQDIKTNDSPRISKSALQEQNELRKVQNWNM